jgi:hypothetical protein
MKSYGQHDIRNRGSCFVTGKIFSLLWGIQTGSGAHLASYTVRIEIFFSRGKAAGQQADQSPSTSDVVKNAWIYTSTISCVLTI